MEIPTTVPGAAASQPTTHIVHAAMQFAWAVRQRMYLVVLSLAVCALLGGLYYATATRYYSAKAELLVMQTGDATLSPTLRSQGEDGNLMPTFQNLIVSDEVIRGAIARVPPELRGIDLPEEARAKWIDIVRKNLSSKVLNKTNIIVLEYQSKDPELAVQMVNAIVESYLDFMDRMHQGTTAEIVEVLTKEKDDLMRQLAEREHELQLLSEEIGALDVGLEDESVHPLVQRAMEFNKSLIAVQKQRVELSASLAALERAVRDRQDLRQYILSMSDEVGRELLLNSLGFNSQEASSQLAMERQLIQDQALLESLYEGGLGDNHPRVQALKRRIALSQQYIAGFQSRIERRMAELQDSRLGPMLIAFMRQRLAEVYQKETSLSAQYEAARREAGQLTGRLAQVEILKNDIAGLRELYTALVKRISTIDLSNDLRTALTSPPKRNDSPVSPSLPRTLFMIVFVGLGIGFAGVYVLDTLDDRFRSIEEMQLQLRTPVMAVIRRMKPREFLGPKSLQVVAEPDSPESEGFRTLRTALALSESDADTIVVSSTEPGDGKSTVAANLAAAFAQAGKKTLLIDGDLRRPGLTAMLGFRGEAGLSRALQTDEPIEEAAVKTIRSTGIENLDVLPAGPRALHPAELLSGSRLAELLAWIENVYDQVVIDSPPVLAAGDTAILGRLADGVLLVVQPEKNRRRVILRAAEYLAVVKIRLIGAVVNRTAKERVPGYDAYDSAYDYHGRDEGEDTVSADGVPFDDDEGIVPRRVA